MDNSFLRSRITPDETIIWEGRPEKKPFILKAALNFLLPFCIVWIAFDSFAIITIFSTDSGLFFLIPFFILHLLPVWVYLGNLILAFRRYRNTQYLITDKNIYLSGGAFTKNVKIKPISRLSDMQSHVGFAEKLCHVGSIVLDGTTTNYRGYNRNPFGLFNENSYMIQAIPDYENLLRRINSLQNNASY